MILNYFLKTWYIFEVEDSKHHRKSAVNFIYSLQQSELLCGALLAHTKQKAPAGWLTHHLVDGVHWFTNTHTVGLVQSCCWGPSVKFLGTAPIAVQKVRPHARTYVTDPKLQLQS